jgi:hypothetical protein
MNVRSNFVSMKFVYVLMSTVLFLSCIKDRSITKKEPDPTDFELKKGDIVINEFVVKGSKNANEFGSNEDWLELYNNTNQTIVMEAGKWFITDAAGTNNRKYVLPEITLNAGEFIVIWCDGLNTVQTQIHTNFNLSASGEDLGLYFDINGSDFEVDQKSYPAQTKDGWSLGRQPDGSENWTDFANPTPGASNN